MTIYNITPVAKPRMTQSDRWKKRPATTKYWQYKDDIRKLGVKLPESNFWVKFYIPMPSSWSNKKKAQYNLQPHQQRPDKDNLEKALYDAVLDEDCRIWDSRVSKYWAYEGSIEIILDI
jgi:Holliday junction resolvase RusA-like endonuclease